MLQVYHTVSQHSLTHCAVCACSTNQATNQAALHTAPDSHACTSVLQISAMSHSNTATAVSDNTPASVSGKLPADTSLIAAATVQGAVEAAATGTANHNAAQTTSDNIAAGQDASTAVVAVNDSAAIAGSSGAMPAGDAVAAAAAVSASSQADVALEASTSSDGNTGQVAVGAVHATEALTAPVPAVSQSLVHHQSVTAAQAGTSGMSAVDGASTAAPVPEFVSSLIPGAPLLPAASPDGGFPWWLVMAVVGTVVWWEHCCR